MQIDIIFKRGHVSMSRSCHDFKPMFDVFVHDGYSYNGRLELDELEITKLRDALTKLLGE